MGLRGTLTKESFGFSMPCDAPLYPAPPYLYEGATMLTFEYETDPRTAVELLPAIDGLELTTEPAATAGVVFARYPQSTLGPYNEVVLYLSANFRGQDVKYGAYLYVTTDAAMAAGRELAGFPKKLASINISDGDGGGGTYRASMERPAGQVMAEAELRLAGPPISMSSLPLHYVTLRLIPSPVRGAAPSLVELVNSTWELTQATLKPAQGTLTLTGVPQNNPLLKAPVRNIKSIAWLQGRLCVDLIAPPLIPLG